MDHDEVYMPIYEYLCSNCKRTFEARRKLAERNEPTACPHCGSERNEYRFSVPAALPVMASGGGESCGPGCCGGACAA